MKLVELDSHTDSHWGYSSLHIHQTLQILYVKSCIYIYIYIYTLGQFWKYPRLWASRGWVSGCLGVGVVVSIKRCRLTRIDIPIMRIRRYDDRLIFIIGTSEDGLYIETWPIVPLAFENDTSKEISDWNGCNPIPAPNDPRQCCCEPQWIKTCLFACGK